MQFEYDPNKSESNAKKHGIDFEQAQALWKDVNRIEIDAKSTDEPRTATIGKIEGKHWTAITTVRGRHIRIISVRRARSKEVGLYEG